MAEKLQTISEIRHQLITMFSVARSVREAGGMATQIVREYTGMEGASQLAYGDRTVSGDDTALIMAAARRAASGEPLQYIFGYTLFCGHRIGVGPGVLIPRPETEEMTSAVITGNNGFEGIALDLCTGSGCIAIALASAFPDAKVYAADFSEPALETAARNAAANSVAVSFFRADVLTEPAESFPPCDIIISNPPYVRLSEKVLMQPNVLDHEPHEALFVRDDDPLVFYRSIAAIATRQLRHNGRLYLEINEALDRETAEILIKCGFTGVTVTEDINGKKRFLKALKDG